MTGTGEESEFRFPLEDDYIMAENIADCMIRLKEKKMYKNICR